MNTSKLIAVLFVFIISFSFSSQSLASPKEDPIIITRGDIDKEDSIVMALVNVNKEDQIFVAR